MDELKYNICYSLGDVYESGHQQYVTLHFTSNYPASAIDKAYVTFVAKTGFDYVRDVCSDYEDNIITEECLNILKELKVIDDDYINENMKWDDEYHMDIYIFIDVFEKIIQTELPNFKTKVRNLDEDEVKCISGAAYGLL